MKTAWLLALAVAISVLRFRSRIPILIVFESSTRFLYTLAPDYQKLKMLNPKQLRTRGSLSHVSAWFSFIRNPWRFL